MNPSYLSIWITIASLAKAAGDCNPLTQGGRAAFPDTTIDLASLTTFRFLRSNSRSCFFQLQHRLHQSAISAERMGPCGCVECHIQRQRCPIQLQQTQGKSSACHTRHACRLTIHRMPHTSGPTSTLHTARLMWSSRSPVVQGSSLLPSCLATTQTR